MVLSLYLLDFQTVFKIANAALALFNLDLISAAAPSFGFIMLPRYVNSYTISIGLLSIVIGGTALSFGIYIALVLSALIIKPVCSAKFVSLLVLFCRFAMQSAKIARSSAKSRSSTLVGEVFLQVGPPAQLIKELEGYAVNVQRQQTDYKGDNRQIAPPGPPGWGLVVGLTTQHFKNTTSLRNYNKS